jgi:hypothetical protein
MCFIFWVTEVQISARRAVIVTEISRESTQTLEANVAIVPQSMPKLFPSNSAFTYKSAIQHYGPIFRDIDNVVKLSRQA